MSPDDAPSKKDALQHWRPPGVCVQRAQRHVGQTQLISTPGRKTSPKMMTTKACAAAHSCRPIPLNAAFDSPLTPARCITSEVDQPELRLTPPSMQSPHVINQRDLENPSRPKSSPSNVHAAADVSEHQHLTNLPEPKHGDEGDEPVRVPTTPGGGRNKQGPLVSISMQGRNCQLSKHCLHASPDVTDDAHPGRKTVRCNGTCTLVLHDDLIGCDKLRHLSDFRSSKGVVVLSCGGPQNPPMWYICRRKHHSA